MTLQSVRSFRAIAKILVAGVFVTVGLFSGLQAFAGGGPENVLVIVNNDSDSSKLIANHYVALRKIPSRNVIYLSNVPRNEEAQFGAFRDKILKPIVEQVKARKLGRHIDYVVYSSDFPTSIVTGPQMKEFLEIARKSPNFPKEIATRNYFLPKASINSLTFFLTRVLSNNPTFMGLESNKYMRTRNQLILSKPFVGETQKKFEEALRLSDNSDYEKALEILKQINVKHPKQVAVAYWMARVHARNNDVGSCVKWLRRSIILGWSFRDYTKRDRAFESLATDPEFVKVIGEIPDDDYRFLPTHGFRSFYHWGNNGMINSSLDQGESYLLSTVLAVTRNQGNSEVDALAQIRRSVAADGTHPKGTFYFSVTKDIRVRTRQNSFPATINELKKLGHKTEVIATRDPVRKSDIAGLVLGTSQFRITKGSKILAGAICENLTSFGGVMSPGKGQTKLTLLIKHGAAGSSGTVVEPLTIRQKFPDSRIQYHYARGCSLAEAFYQSVHGPFQLLIVGDALCQPYATFPKLEVKGLESDQTVKGKVNLELDFSTSPVKVGGIEVYIDGMLIQRANVRNEINFDTNIMPDGYHELRIVAIAADNIESTGRSIIPFWVNNKGHEVSVKASTLKPSFKGAVDLQVKANFGESITLFKGAQKLGTKQGSSCKFSIKSKVLGRGPVDLIVGVKDGETLVRSVPVRIDVQGAPSPHIKKYGTPSKSGGNKKKGVPNSRKKAPAK